MGREPLVQLCMFSDKWLQRYRLLENTNIKILLLQDVLDFDLAPPPPPRHGPYWVPMVQVLMVSNNWLQRYRLLENFNTEILLFEDVLDFDL